VARGYFPSEVAIECDVDNNVRVVSEAYEITMLSVSISLLNFLGLCHHIAVYVYIPLNFCYEAYQIILLCTFLTLFFSLTVRVVSNESGSRSSQNILCSYAFAATELYL
jgi:hypothetical protein